MADDRISRETAELIPLPPHTWYVKTIGWLLDQPKVKENIENVPSGTGVAGGSGAGPAGSSVGVNLNQLRLKPPDGVSRRRT